MLRKTISIFVKLQQYSFYDRRQFETVFNLRGKEYFGQTLAAAFMASLCL